MAHLQTKLNLLPILIFLIASSLLTCTKSDQPTPAETEDDSLVFESFRFEQANNPRLSADVTFDVQENAINGRLKHFFYEVTPTFMTNAASVEINGVEQRSGSSKVDFRKKIIYTLKSAEGTSKNYAVNLAWDNQLAQVNISTTGRVPVNSKTEYVPTQVTIDGQQQYADFAASAQIRGRGNTTWTFPKKPFKIKLDEDAEVLGIKAERDWVLLANYLDGTHLMNAVGMKIGQLLEMPFTNNIVPVEVSLNGEYLGLYNLTEQIEVKRRRVDVGNDGLLLNLDTNFDEPWQFQSSAFQLPVTIKFPKDLDAQKHRAIWDEFQAFEALVASPDFPSTNYLDYFDAESFVNYLIVYMLTGNEEINHPKSTYIYKTAEGKYTMGPIWDFDWAFAYEGSLEHFSSFDRPLFWSPPGKGTVFFSKLLEDPVMRDLFKERWTDFQVNQLPELLTYIDDYAFIIRGARTRDFALWAQGLNNYDVEVAKMKNWLSDRARWMTREIANL
ncbi:MAG: CotH kinase family protein [Bacteroidota bacterium]